MEHNDPVLLSADITSEQKALVDKVKPVVSKPKPKAEAKDEKPTEAPEATPDAAKEVRLCSMSIVRPCWRC
jgi:hypothetical protein